MSYGDEYESRTHVSAAATQPPRLRGDTAAFSEQTTTRPEPPGQCEWFVLCENRAVRTRAHPILGDVPICHRCDSRAEHDESVR